LESFCWFSWANWQSLLTSHCPKQLIVCFFPYRFFVSQTLVKTKERKAPTGPHMIHTSSPPENPPLLPPPLLPLPLLLPPPPQQQQQLRNVHSEIQRLQAIRARPLPFSAQPPLEQRDLARKLLQQRLLFEGGVRRVKRRCAQRLAYKAHSQNGKLRQRCSHQKGGR
jgi:hypothetical protein